MYAYTTPTVTSNEGWIKIGYTERDVTQRIKEQTHTAHIATDVLWTGDAAYTEEPDKGKTFKDHDFHHFLSFHDVERRPKTEWFYFNGTPEKSKNLFDKFVQHDLSGYQPGKGQDYTLRQEQEEAVAKTLAYFQEHAGGKFLWNAKPRFGKTLSTYDLARRMEAVNVLIVTNRPAIANSWYDDFETFIAGQTTYKFVSESDSLKSRPILSRQEFLGILADDVRQLAFIS
ncbi:DEAD/DEAH box helicase family protein, partial [Streptococcus pneumoniae]